MMDANGDGKLSLEEHATRAKKMFDIMDANKDGKVTAAEMDDAQGRMMGQMGQVKKEKAGKSDEKPNGKGMSSADKIKMVDKDGDGVLTAEEHTAGSKMVFEKMDTDLDGFLTKAELAAGHAKMMHKPSK